MRRILLVEDDAALAEVIRDYLNAHGYEVLIEPDGAAAMLRFTHERPALVILDVMLPGKDGYQICRELRAASKVPVLMYTSRREDFDQILGLELGADDYVVKTLEPRVLLARINSLLRRTTTETTEKPRESRTTVGPVSINRPARLVTYDGEKVELTAADFDLFMLLFNSRGHLVTRDQLQRVLRNIPYDGVGRAMDGRIFRLRKKFSQVGAAENFIVSVRSKGYVLALEDPLP